MIRVFKELYVRGEWVLHSELRIPDLNGLWGKMHVLGDVFRRKYTPLVSVAINFHGSECLPHHISSTNLNTLRNQIGKGNFDREFGSWPFDHIDIFQDAESKNELMAQYSISDARVIAWRE